MDEDDPRNIGRYSLQSVNFTAESECRYFELLRYSEAAGVHQSEGTLDDISLLGWLDKDLRLLFSSPLPPSGGLRLLIGFYHSEKENALPELSIGSAAFKLIERKFGLPRYLLDLTSVNFTRAYAFTAAPDAGSQRIGFAIKITYARPVSYLLALVYDPKTNLTEGLLLARKCSDVSVVLAPLLDRLKDYQDVCDEPSLSAILTAEIEMDLCNARLKKSDRGLNELEESMGQHEYDNRPRGNVHELDFPATTRRLNYISKKVGVDVVRLGSTLIALELMVDWKGKIDNSKAVVGLQQAESETGLACAIADEGSNLLDEKVAYLIHNCRVLIMMAEYEEKRARTLIQVVYQFMAQRDAKVNIALAESSAMIARASKEDSAVMRTIAIASKRDSSAMKSMAIFGMLFLPGAFIAAIFAMPVFEWDTDGAPKTKTGFAYYWAVTIPVTLLVLATWGIATALPWDVWLTGDKIVGDRRRRKDVAEHIISP